MAGQPTGRVALWLALIVTNAIKLGGLVVALDEILVQPIAKPLPLVVAVVMMTGAQSVEEAVFHFVERFFGVGTGLSEPEKDGKAQ